MVWRWPRVTDALFRSRRYRTPGSDAERTSGQTAGFTGFQKKRPGQHRADRAVCAGLWSGDETQPVLSGLRRRFTDIRRSSAAMPSSTARFCSMRFDWL